MKLAVAGCPLTSKRPVRLPTDLRIASMSCVRHTVVAARLGAAQPAQASVRCQHGWGVPLPDVAHKHHVTRAAPVTQCAEQAFRC